MKITVNKPKITSFLFIILIVLNFNSCDIFIKNNEAEKAKASKIDKNISMDKSEAKLLVMASQDNLDLIEFCEILEEKKADDIVKDLVIEIKEEQILILDKYHKIALDNVISIPNYSDLKLEEKKVLIKTDNVEDHLKLLSIKINNQIELLEKLSDTTNNSEFKKLAQFAYSALKSNLTKTNKTLKTLNTNS